MQRVALLLFIAAAVQGQEQLTFSASAPPAPSSVGASANGARGGTTLYYWVIARYPGGASSASMAMAFSTVGGGNLSVSNFVRVSWAPAAGATGYDVLRSETPQFPGPSCGACAVVLNTAGTSVDDNGGSLSAYPPGGLNTAVPVTASVTINTRDGTVPYVNLQLLSIRINEVLRVGLISGTPAEDDCIKYAGGRLVSAGAACGTGGGGGGGATVPSQLGCTITVAGATLTLFSTASNTSPCVIGSRRYVTPETVTLGASAPSGVYSFEFRYDSGQIRLFARPPGGNTATVTGSANITVESASGFSNEGTPFFTWDGAPSLWTLGAGTDFRSFLTTQTDVTGVSGLSCSRTGGLVTCAINTAVIADLASAQTFSGKKTFTGSINVFCTTLPPSPALGDLACDNGDANKLKRYNGTAWLEVGGGVVYNAPETFFYQWLPVTPSNHGIVSATNPTVQHINFPNQLIGRVAFSNNAGVGAGAVARIGIFAPGCQTKLYESDAYTGSGGTTTYISFPTQISLPGGTYCVMTGSNSPTFTVGFLGAATLVNNAMNNTVVRTGVCANGMVGAGATATLPLSCGAITAGNTYYQYIWLP